MTIGRPGTGAAATCAIAALLFAVDPATTDFYPSCLFRAWTGLLCPLCGSLRAAHALLHGHLTEAFFLNPLTVSTAALAAIFYATNNAARLASPRALRIAVLGGLAFTIARNLPACLPLTKAACTF